MPTPVPVSGEHVDAHGHGSAAALRIAGTIYGTIVVLAVIVAAAPSETGAGQTLVLVFSTSLVFWLAHVYCHVLAIALTEGRRAISADVRATAHRESPMLLAAVLPCVALAVGALTAMADRTALWLAFAIGAATLVGTAVAYARTARFSALGTAGAIAINLAAALVLVLLKILVSH